jgi:hypothetical protein
LRLAERDGLIERRRDRLSFLQAMRRILDCEAELSISAEGRQVLAGARAYLDKSVTDTAEFAGMARAARANGYWLK